MAEAYIIRCHACQTAFDALAAPWCACLVTERTVVCPQCSACFCKAPPAYKQKVWAAAPKALWDRKFEEHREEMPTENPPPESARRPLVLLVEDEKNIRRTAVRTIQAMGYGLVVATNGAEGLDLAKRYKPDLVLSDALMPKLDGREMCRKIKEDPATARTKVVVMTALYTAAKYRTEALRSFRVDDYLSKPLDLSQLQALLTKHLGPSRA